MTALRGGFKSRSATIFIDLEKNIRSSIKRSLTKISGTTRHSRPAPDVAGRLPYEPNRNCTNSRKEVQSQPSDKWHTTGKQHEFNMVINQLLQLNLGSKVQMIAYTDNLAIHGGPIGGDILYKQMTTALKKIETKAIQLGLKFSPDKCEAIWYRSNEPDWNFKIAGEGIPWRTLIKYLRVLLLLSTHTSMLVWRCPSSDGASSSGFLTRI